MPTDNHDTQIQTAIRQGKLPKLDGSVRCTDCDAPASEYDHRDETDALNVEPVCHKCNLKRGPAMMRGNLRNIRINLTPDQHAELRACAALTRRSIVSILSEAALAFIAENRHLLTNMRNPTKPT